MDILVGIVEAFVNFVYPPTCMTCWRDLRRGEFFICTKCWDSFERVSRTETIIQAIERKFLIDETVDKIDAVFLFEQDPRVRAAVHLLKYGGAERIADKFGLFIAKKIVDDTKLSMCDILAPVPLHPARKRERGYNQSELIAERLSNELQVRHEPDLLRRVRHTQSQTMFDAEGRKRNIAGAFSIADRFLGEVKGKKILLVDDVITTGSTIKECAGVLRVNGASEVYGAAAAVTI
ncbi:MAG: ComF family protein [Bacteroidetes bacterium]|nr:ComF family protein [Bacteroidota bacterium]